ncbi:MAG: acyl-CoA dehydrogenase family protein [Alphaproteobacteria bacterium]|nr:acyl-CoA dehydrogenase family protein [Alphaproteobacteria bacterium]
MALVLSEDAQLVRDQAMDFFREKSPILALRKLRDSNDADGFSRALWKEMADLGWAGFVVSEESGGSGFGMVGLGQVLEAAGRTLAASPLISTALIGASALDIAGTQAQKSAYLSGLLAGDVITALASDEGAHHAPDSVATIARADGDGFVLDGRKSFVLDGHVADLLIVSARTEGGITLFLVPTNAAGVTVQRRIMVDSRNAAIVTLAGVRVGANAVLGGVGGGAGLLDRLLDRARVGLAAEMLGSSCEAFERTVQYLKERKQFGVAIGTFQALKHRAAQMFAEIEVTRSAVLAALVAIDEGSTETPALASLAKAKANTTFNLTSSEGIQMHGGIGMTDEHEIGFFLKRSRVAEITFGSTGFHGDRYAALMGY